MIRILQMLSFKKLGNSRWKLEDNSSSKRDDVHTHRLQIYTRKALNPGHKIYCHVYSLQQTVEYF